jgi:CDP-diacylglycerol--glycerol-3-phosphate 3-phosphatidyltransferase
VFDGRFRDSVDRGVSPIGAALRRTGISPDHLTALGLVLAVPAAVVVASGRLVLGLILVVLSALPDLLDGAVAKATGLASPRGAFFDSVSDRVTDSVILGGVAWYLQSRHHGHAALLVFAVLGASTLISYERAKAEALGFEAKGGLMERAERTILLCVGLAFSAILVPLLWVMLALTALTAVQRFVKVWRQAAKPVPIEPPVTVAPAERPRPQAAPVAVSARWRAWREANGWPSAALWPNRFAEGTRRRGTTRWEQRRLARRERAEREGVGELTSWRRRADGRRP